MTHKSEAQTRQEIIDEKLRLAGWNVDDPTQVIQELDINLADAGYPVPSTPSSPYSGHQFADYALVLNGKPVVVVEAKKASVDAQLGQEQALRYAENLQKIHGGSIPFITYTNGYDIHLWDSDFYPPTLVHGFPTRDDVEWMEQRRKSRRPLSVELINTDIAGRDFQIEAIRTILEAAEKRRRKFLLVMATGTGKTRTAVALIDVLMRARWAQRVLFLVDRIALQEQALDAFKEHIPSEPRWPDQPGEPFTKSRRVYVTTYQTMLNLIQSGTTAQTWISPHFFDVVIADESHRSIYNTYKQVLDYFNAIKLGLTATPTDRIEHDTFSLFECDTYDPTFAFAYEDAVNHSPPYLVDFEVLKVRSKFQLEGIHGGQLPPSIQSKLVAEGKDVGDIDFEGTDLERKVSNSGTNALILREFMEECIKDSTGTLPAKTIIFAISKAHARRLLKVFDELYPEHKGKLARVLVSEDRFVYGKGGLLDQFKNEDMPRIAISVDLMDTGLDVREVCNLVFAKPVYSFVKFWQMIGRGTRILDADPKKRKIWCTEKDRFLIIDCWENFEFFDMQPRGREPGEQTPLPVRLFKARLDKLEVAMNAGQTVVAEAVIADLQADIATLPANNVAVEEKRAELDKIDDTFWQSLNQSSIDQLRGQIAPILRARTGSDFKAMRFETDVVELGTAFLMASSETAEGIQESIVSDVSELPLTVNVVAREKALIQDVLTDQWWADIDEHKLQSLVDRLAPLMGYRKTNTRPMVFLDIEDALAVKDWIEFGPEGERMPVSAYKDKVESHIYSLVAENPVLQKMQRGETVTPSEIMELAGLLHSQDPWATEEVLRKVYDHPTARFIAFMRHIMGVEVLESWEETVANAFDQFIMEHNTMTSLQLRFVQTLRTFILQTGKVERRDLIDAPFTRLHPQGIRGVFQPSEIDEILEFTEALVA